MKHLHLRAILLCILIAFAFSACKTINEENIYIINKEKKGSVFGFVRLFDEFGQPLKDNRGLEVKLAGLQPEIKTMSDSAGRYQLDSITAGTYLIQYTKSGYGRQEMELPFTSPGGNEPKLIAYPELLFGWMIRPYIYIYQVCSTEPALPQAEANTRRIDTTSSYDSILVFKGTISPSGTELKPRAVVIYFDTVPGVSHDRYLYGVVTRSIRTGSYRLPLSTQYTQFLKKGRTYYARAYGSPYYGSEVFDRKTGKYLSTNMNPNPSPEFTFTPRW